MTKTRILINGYGRIGRLLHRITIKDPDSPLEVIGINSRANAESHAHLLKYDSTYGILDQKIDHGEDYISVNSKKVKVFMDKNPGEIDLLQEGVDIVAECSGKFRDRENCEKQLKAGAKKVVISAPGKGEDISIVLGVNEKNYQPNNHHIISNASCTTNCLGLVVKVLKENFGILSGQMTTIHALTLTQNMLDGSNEKNLRIARASIESMIPASTGASESIGKIFPELQGRLNAISVRVPFSTVSVIDLVVNLEKRTTAEKINQTFLKASQASLKSLLGITMKPLVSIDFRGDSRSAIVDGLTTNVVGGKLAKIFAWYDNEWGYTCRLYDLIKFVS